MPYLIFTPLKNTKIQNRLTTQNPLKKKDSRLNIAPTAHSKGVSVSESANFAKRPREPATFKPLPKRFDYKPPPKKPRLRRGRGLGVARQSLAERNQSRLNYQHCGI